MRLPLLAWIPFALATMASSAHAQKPGETPAPLPPLPPPPPTTAIPPAPPSPPASTAPTAAPSEAPPPATPSEAEGFDVQLSANARNLQFHIWTDEGRYLKVCTMPCRAPF